MIEALRADPGQLGEAFHELFMGQDTDRAEGAAWLLGQLVSALLK